MVVGVVSEHQGIAHPLEQLGECPPEIVGIKGILRQLLNGMNNLNSEAKICQKKIAKMEVWGQTINHQMDELQTEVTRAQEKTKEQVEKLERTCCGKLTEHQE